MKQKLFTLFLALVASVSAIYASDTKVDGIWYDFNEYNKTATVTYRGNSEFSYYDEYSGSVVIPSSVTYYGTTYTVTSIGKEAFNGCSSLTSVTIGNSVTSIGYWAFSGCSSLTSVTIPNSVTSIGGSAFKECSSLTSITIPNSVTSIGDFAFISCSSLTSVTINSDAIVNKTYTDSYNLSDDIFGSQVTEYIIGDNVKGIGDFAFFGCSSLTSITIPNSVTSIGEYAFCGCSSLTSVTIPNSVTSIGYWAFSGCSSLTSVTIGNSVTKIGYEAFYRTSIYNNAANWVNGVLYINNCLIYAKTSISGAYAIKEGTRVIANRAFEYCYSLTSVTIPNSVTSIGYKAFDECHRLVDVYCYATTPPIVYDAYSFDKYDAYLYIPCESKKAYMEDAVWGNFKYIECISSEGIENVQGNEVQSTKVVKDGQVLILRNSKTYTMQGQEVK